MLYSWDRLTYDANKEPVVKGALSGPSLDASLTQNMSDGQRLLLNTLLNYDVRVKEKHNFKILAGVEKITGESMDLMAFRRGFVSTAIDQIFAGASLAKDNGGSATQSARLNYFGRVNYDFLQKYLLEFVWRYDGSYIFSDKRRFGFSPEYPQAGKFLKKIFGKTTSPLLILLNSADRGEKQVTIELHRINICPVMALALHHMCSMETWKFSLLTNFVLQIQTLPGK